MKRLFASLAILLALTHCSIAVADTLGRVVGIIDGDTIDVLTPGKELLRVRLAGIDAPEKRQPFGAAAKKGLSELAFDKTVILVGDKSDRYGRRIARVLVGERDANLQMVMSGLAWHYKKYEREQLPADRGLYADAQATAQRKHMGLWSEPSPTAPWDYRRQRRASR